VRRINRLLKKAGIENRLVRGNGYYYVTGVAVSSGLYVYVLDNTEEDFQMAYAHVKDVLKQDSKFN
jgi:hypothetical protein